MKQFEPGWVDTEGQIVTVTLHARRRLLPRSQADLLPVYGPSPVAEALQQALLAKQRSEWEDLEAQILGPTADDPLIVEGR